MISKEFPTRYVLTTNGVKDIKDVYPGDYVYQWRTCKPLEIKSIQMLPFHTMYELVYSDGRTQNIVDPEAIYLDQATVPPHSPFCKCLRTRDFPIQLYPLDFTRYSNKVNLPLDPDPYVTGGLIVYGDLTDEYVNYPIEYTGINNQFSHMYNIDYYPILTGGKTYFQHKGQYTENRITWKEFFRNSQFRATGDNDKIIPDEYLYTQPWNRVQFLRGAFDMGYIQRRSPNNVALYHDDMEKLELVRTILNTLGVSCSIYTEKEDVIEPHRLWLEVEGLPDTWPGFFYDYNYIAHMVNKSIGKDYHQKDNADANYSTVALVDINNLGCPRFWRNPVPHIVLEESHMAYVSPNYLPMVSI